MSIDSVVGSLAELIDRPLVLYDADLDVVAYSAHTGEVDRARGMHILERRATPRGREMLRASRAAFRAGPVRLPAERDVPPRIVYRVLHEGAMLGYLIYVELGESADVTESIGQELDRHAAELGRLLHARALDRQESRVRLRTLMSDLTSAEVARRAAAASSLLAEESLPAAAQYTGIVLVPADAAGLAAAQQQTMLEAALAEFIRAARRSVVGAVTEGAAALAVMAGDGGACAPFAQVPPQECTDVRVGVGAPVRALPDVAASVRQARIVARACLIDPDRSQKLARWDALGLDRILLQLPLENLTIDDLPAPVARLLSAASGPDLAVTVEAYLDCAGDAQAAAARLTIHRSTFYYRLDRIREVSGADLRDGETGRELHTGLRVARLAGLGSFSGCCALSREPARAGAGQAASSQVPWVPGRTRNGSRTVASGGPVRSPVS